MKLSNQIRNHIIKNHMKPARKNNRNELTIRAGDIHEELGYSNRMPAVCSVLGSNKLQNEAHIQLAKREGPHNGANARFFYILE